MLLPPSRHHLFSTALVMLRSTCSSFNVVRRSAQHIPSTVRLASFATSSRKVSTSPSDPPPPASASTSKTPTSKQKPRHRRVAATQENDGQPEQKRLLQPYVLSRRLTTMCREGKLDEAYEYLQSLPVDAQNVSVWNTMISQAGGVQRFRLMYQIYTEMKRRGFKPNLMTYATLMGQYSSVSSWSARTKMIEDVHKVYQSFLDYIATVKAHNPSSPEISVIPINAYIRALSRMGDHQRMFDVWNALDEEGPLSPDVITYTTMFRSMYLRGYAASREDLQADRERAASDARLIWRHLAKRLENGSNIAIDSPLISSVVQALALGRPADHIVAFDILRDYAGLAKPGETAPPPRIKIYPALLQDALWLCNTAQKPRLCIHFGQHLMETQPDLLDRGHIDLILTAYSTLSTTSSITDASRALQTLEWAIERDLTVKEGARVRPGLSTYTLVLVVCWRVKDWESAVRTFELMTGYQGKDFADGAQGEPQRPPDTDRRKYAPGAAAMSCLVRTALETGNPAAMRQCLRIVKHIGLSRLLTSGPPPGNEYVHRAGARFRKDHSFYVFKTAQAVVDTIDVLVPKKTGESAPLTADDRVWVELRKEARRFLINERENRPRHTPELEEQPLGSGSELAAIDNAVEWTRIHREQKSAR
ncbi:hypothetical protein GY45DRAFT_808189 [Cubamyces sp. BRFM 1775]|nr:hypothetical protein GY45DRAFT_808189 [Cubamyces sp. BRFM 1775]